MSASAAPAAVIVDRAGLEALVADVAREDAYAFDTEFHTERTYVPELALIQIHLHIRQRAAVGRRNWNSRHRDQCGANQVRGHVIQL